MYKCIILFTFRDTQYSSCLSLLMAGLGLQACAATPGMPRTGLVEYLHILILDVLFSGDHVSEVGHGSVY